MTEDQLVAAIARRLQDVAPAKLLVGIGDDAAVWQPSRNNRSVITTDALVEGIDFTKESMSAQDAGYRALAANLSDIAAMGARPVLATVTLGFPAGTDTNWLLACYDGIASLAKSAQCPVAGGDITRAPSILLSISIVGEVRASNLKLRSGARPGDVLVTTGPLGASHAGMLVALDRPDLAADPAFAGVLAAFRRPQPRLREGRWLGASRHVHAMMDISDGLSTDVARLCDASGCGAVIETVPVAQGATHDGALNGGEDFELLAAVDKRAFAHLATRFRSRFAKDLLRVGTIIEGAGVRFANGAVIAPAGWDHLR